LKRILIIEDDPALNKNIKEALMAEQMEVETVFDGLLAERVLKKNSFDCVILDINLPHKNGYELCKDFRKHNTITPILILTAFDELEDKVQGYDCGADDYLTKPFYMKELILRVTSLLKRSTSTVSSKDSNTSTIVVGDLVIHTANKKVTRQGKEITLTPREYQILLRLVLSKGELVPKKELIKEIWGTAFDANTNTIEVYINFLRKKLDKPFGKDSIKTKIGFGYYFDEK
jgi:DNA-binding response OmpR family regulator